MAARPSRAAAAPFVSLSATQDPLAQRKMRQALVASLGVHVGALLIFACAGLWQGPPAPPQQVLVARLVRLGPERPKEQLPQLATARAPTFRPQPTAAPAPPAAKRASAAATGAAPAAKTQPPRRASAETQSALARLKREAAGAQDGDVAGDTDVQEQGDRYAALLHRCLKDNFVIEGVEAGRLVGLKALVVLRIQADGRIISHRIERSAGMPAFDQAIARAVRRCEKVSPPPVAWQRQLRTEGIGIEFSP